MPLELGTRRGVMSPGQLREGVLEGGCSVRGGGGVLEEGC